MQIGTDFDVRHHFEFDDQFNESRSRRRSNMGHSTPTNVLAWAEEQNTEQHNAIPVACFFTSHFPHHRLLPTRHDQASSTAIPPAPVEPKPDANTGTNSGINVKQIGKIEG
jgi:hypothetical protein